VRWPAAGKRCEGANLDRDRRRIARDSGGVIIAHNDRVAVCVAFQVWTIKKVACGAGGESFRTTAPFTSNSTCATALGSVDVDWIEMASPS
jgi:hypothetical protein